MNKSKHYWSINSTQHDSGSESAPLLSSESHTSMEPIIFHDSETSDLDCNPYDNFSRYGSVEKDSCHLSSIPKRLPPLTQDQSLVSPTLTRISCPISTADEKCYEVSNANLILDNGKCESKETLLKDFSVQSLCKDRPKQSSLITVFSIWNTILGSSLLTMPWGIEMAGFLPGIILILAISGICVYSAYCLLVVHKYHGGHDDTEVIDLCRIYLNKWAEYIARIFSITVLLGATIAYWILMSNFLYNSVNFIYDNVISISQYTSINNTSGVPEVLCPHKAVYNDTSITIVHERSYDMLGPVWDLYKTVPTFLGLLIFPLLNFSSPTFFTKFNSLGTVSVLYLIVFIVIKSASWGINMDDTMWEASWTLKPTFAALSGMLALSFFIHNIIISIMQNNHDQSKNGRDLSIAYVLVTITYIVIGTAFYLSFPLSKSCIEDNLLNNFQKWDGMTVGARIVLLFQLLTVYPLLAYMLRIQLLSTVCKTINRGCVIIVNVILVSICILFATFIPYVGTIIRYTGALSGFIYVFTLPSLLYLIILKKQEKLTAGSLILHISIPVIGALNLIAQFFISDH